MASKASKWLEKASRYPVKGRPIELVRRIVENLVRDQSYVLEYVDEDGFRALLAVVDTCKNVDDAANLELLALRDRLPTTALPDIVNWAVEVASKGPCRNLDIELWTPHGPLEAGLAHLDFAKAYAMFRMEWRGELPGNSPSTLPLGARWQVLEPSRVAEFYAVMTLAFSQVPGASVPSREEMTQTLRRRTYLPEVLVCDDRVIAFADTRIYEHGEGEIYAVGRHPAWRGQGLGDAIVWRALQRLCARGVNRIRLEVAAVNDDALSLYRRHGFTIAEKLPVWRLSLRN
jgi:GNAT superfamily N-acetyltransferase